MRVKELQVFDLLIFFNIFFFFSCLGCSIVTCHVAGGAVVLLSTYHVQLFYCHHVCIVAGVARATKSRKPLRTKNLVDPTSTGSNTTKLAVSAVY